MPNPLIALSVALLALALGWWLFAPERGVFWRWQRTRLITDRVLQEDALKHIHQCEIHQQRPSIKSLAGSLNITPDEAARLLATLEELNLLKVEGRSFRLTPSGREYALHIIRAHRLWERYLADSTGFGEEEWHGQAELQEHTLSPDEVSQLAIRLGNPAYDPHGDPIPTASGDVVYQQRVPLTAMEVDKPARIVHIEDEPEAVYAQIVAEGLHVGMVVRVLESTSQRIRFWSGDDEHTLAPLIATNIAVEPIEEQQPKEPLGEPLTQLKPGEQARVIGITERIRGVERRRLMDLGFLPDTIIRKEMDSPGGDPAAYRVRGALIALRSTQTDHIRVKRINE